LTPDYCSGVIEAAAYTSMLKTIVILVLTGAIVGAVIASYVVPPAVAWYTEPGGLPGGATINAVVQIPEVIRYATGRLIRGQLIGGGIGAAAGLIAGIMMGVRSRQRRKV
jgi:hypothetical protein